MVRDMAAGNLVWVSCTDFSNASTWDSLLEIEDSLENYDETLVS